MIDVIESRTTGNSDVFIYASLSFGGQLLKERICSIFFQEKIPYWKDFIVKGNIKDVSKIVAENDGKT